MVSILRLVNPFARIGIRNYSTIIPLLFTVLSYLVIELLTLYVVRDPDSVGIFIIFISVALVMYFSFRDGIRGGFLAAAITLFYYTYIIFSRNYSGDQFRTSLNTTIILSLLFFILAAIIGWLKQSLDAIVLKEIDARLAAEEGHLRLQTILQQLPVGVLLVDVRSGIIEGNRQVEKILGKKVHMKLPQHDSEVSTNARLNQQPMPLKDWPITRAITKGEVISGEELEYWRDGKKQLFLRVNAAPIRNTKHEIVAAVSTFYDITQQKEMEQRKDDFVNMASHELKTPLTSMKLYIDSLQKRLEKNPDERLQRIVTNVKLQTNRLQELVNDLLDVSRIQTGKLSFSKEFFSLDTLIEESIEMLQETSKHTIEFTKKTHIKVHGDRFRIYQVITNLLTNAIKYSPQESEIVVKLKREAGHVVLSVQDFGIGISKDQSKKIFERLYQVTDPTEKTFPGLGMGLYISREIVRRHKGKIWVESEKGKGSTFFVSLPLGKK